MDKKTFWPPKVCPCKGAAGLLRDQLATLSGAFYFHSIQNQTHIPGISRKLTSLAGSRRQRAASIHVLLNGGNNWGNVQRLTTPTCIRLTPKKTRRTQSGFTGTEVSEERG
jgi:hypothetical protein